MSRRSGASIKAILVVGVAGLFVYGVYSYHEIHTRLKSSLEKEDRLKQQSDSLSAQLQVIYEHKARLEKSLQTEKQSHQKTKEACTSERAEVETRFLNDKDDLMNRLKAVNQELSMLKSQHEDTQSEYTKIQEAHLKLEEDHERVVAQHNQEYQQLKQEKNNEIATLKDTIADIQRRYNDVQAKYSSLLQSDILNKNQLQQQQAANVNQQQQLQQAQQLQQNLQQQLQQHQLQNQQVAGVGAGAGIGAGAGAAGGDQPGVKVVPYDVQGEQLKYQQQQGLLHNLMPQQGQLQLQQNLLAQKQAFNQQDSFNQNQNHDSFNQNQNQNLVDQQNQPAMQVKAPGEEQHPGYHEVKLNVLDQNKALNDGQFHAQGQGDLGGDVIAPGVGNIHKEVQQQQVFAPEINDKEEELDQNNLQGNHGEGSLFQQGQLLPPITEQPPPVENKAIEDFEQEEKEKENNDVKNYKFVRDDEKDDKGGGSVFTGDVDDDDNDDDGDDAAAADDENDDTDDSNYDDDETDDTAGVIEVVESALMPPIPVDFPPRIMLNPPVPVPPVEQEPPPVVLLAQPAAWFDKARQQESDNDLNKLNKFAYRPQEQPEPKIASQDVYRELEPAFKETEQKESKAVLKDTFDPPYNENVFLRTGEKYEPVKSAGRILASTTQIGQEGHLAQGRNFQGLQPPELENPFDVVRLLNEVPVYNDINHQNSLNFEKKFHDRIVDQFQFKDKNDFDHESRNEDRVYLHENFNRGNIEFPEKGTDNFGGKSEVTFDENNDFDFDANDRRDLREEDISNRGAYQIYKNMDDTDEGFIDNFASNKNLVTLEDGNADYRFAADADYGLSSEKFRKEVEYGGHHIADVFGIKADDFNNEVADTDTADSAYNNNNNNNFNDDDIGNYQNKFPDGSDGKEYGSYFNDDHFQGDAVNRNRAYDENERLEGGTISDGDNNGDYGKDDQYDEGDDTYDSDDDQERTDQTYPYENEYDPSDGNDEEALFGGNVLDEGNNMNDGRFNDGDAFINSYNEENINNMVNDDMLGQFFNPDHVPDNEYTQDTDENARLQFGEGDATANAVMDISDDFYGEKRSSLMSNRYGAGYGLGQHNVIKRK